jgi:hypothetical protein
MPEYTVTKNAPDEINGKRAAAGDTVLMTETQAEHLLRKRHIEPKAIVAPDQAPQQSAPPAARTAPRTEAKAVNGNRD